MDSALEAKLWQLVTKWTSQLKWRRDYDKWVDGRIWQENYWQEEIEELCQNIDDLESKKILDLGCGMGGFSVALSRNEIDVVPLDFNSDYCQITKLRGERYDLRLSPVNGMGEQLPFRNCSFDAVTCFDVLEHVYNPAQVLSEAYRVLKPGGKMLLTLINRYVCRDPHYHLRFINWMPKRIAEWYIRMRGHSKDDSPCKDKQKISEMHYFTFSQFKRIATNLNFDVADMVERKISRGDIKALRMKRIIMVLRRLKIERVLYQIARLFVMNSFTVLLTKSQESGKKSAGEGLKN